jgi:Ca2+-binding RTX toxin-like protein
VATGTYTLSYTIRDVYGATASSTVTLAVVSTTNQTESVTINLTGNDYSYIDAQGQADTVTGAIGDSITGAAGIDYLKGGGGNDSLSGLSGDDSLVGEGGDDTLTGGSGNDKFIYFAPIERLDRITDFLSGTDKLAFASSVFSAAFALNVNNTGATATTTMAQFTYNISNGLLTNDGDGSGSAGSSTIAYLFNSGSAISDLQTSDIIFF